MSKLARNFALVLFVGVAGSFWVFLFTDLLPVLEGLLGLGGIFAWVAFSFSCLTDATREALQSAFERQLNLDRTMRLLAAAMVALLAWAGIHGAVELESLADDNGHFVKIFPGCAGPLRPAEAKEVYLPPHAKATVLRLTTPLRSRSFTIVPTGLPPHCVSVTSLRITEIHVPASFLRDPVLLIRPTLIVATTTAANEYSLLITVNGVAAGSIPHDQGTTVWVGASRDVSIPLRLQNRWQFELKTQNLEPSLIFAWSDPLGLDEIRLRAGDRVAAVVQRADGGQFARAEALVSGTEPGAFRPQEVILSESI